MLAHQQHELDMLAKTHLEQSSLQPMAISPKKGLKTRSLGSPRQTRSYSSGTRSRHGAQAWRRQIRCETASVRVVQFALVFQTTPHRPSWMDTVADFTAIPQIISHAFVHQMKVNPPDHPVLVTEAPWNTPENRQRMAQIMFEEFKVPAFYIANNAVLSSSVLFRPLLASAH